jgi:hypothetical protein
MACARPWTKVSAVSARDPLEVGDEPGAVVEHAEQVGGDPRPLGGQHLPAPLVIVGMPQGVHVRDLEGADLDRRALLLGA